MSVMRKRQLEGIRTLISIHKRIYLNLKLSQEIIDHTSPLPAPWKDKVVLVELHNEVLYVVVYGEWFAMDLEAVSNNILEDLFDRLMSS